MCLLYPTALCGRGLKAHWMHDVGTLVFFLGGEGSGGVYSCFDCLGRNTTLTMGDKGIESRTILARVARGPHRGSFLLLSDKPELCALNKKRGEWRGIVLRAAVHRVLCWWLDRKESGA